MVALQFNRYPELFSDMDLENDVALLYPSKDAIPLDSIAHKPRHLLVLDGTWYQAKGIYSTNKWLHNLPKVKINNL